MRFLFRKEAINELIDLVHCSQEEAGRIVDAAYKIHNDSKYAKSKYNDSRWRDVSGVELPDGFGGERYCQAI